MVDTDINVNLNFKTVSEGNLKNLSKEFAKINQDLKNGSITQKKYQSEVNNLINKYGEENFKIVGQQQVANREFKKQQTAQKALGKTERQRFKDTEKWQKSLTAFSVTLPLMFGFQQVSKGVDSLIDPSLELLGVTDLYNTFLALKYLPTAEEQLDNVLNTGEAWLEEDESVRKSEGDMLLFTKQIADSIAYMAEWVNIGKAIGSVGGEIGEIIGSGLGLAFGAAGAAAVAFNADGSLVVSQLSGIDAAALMVSSSLLTDLKSSLDTVFGSQTDQNIIDTKEEVDDLWKSIDKLPEQTVIDILANIKASDQELWEYVKSKSETTGVGKEIVANVDTGKAKTSGNVPTVPELNKIIDETGGEKITSVKKSSVLSSLTPAGILSTAMGLTKSVINPAGILGQLFGIKMDTGGVVPGPTGAPMPILAHGGETVLPTHKEDASGFGNQSIVINISGVSSPDDTRRMIEQSINNLKMEIRRLNG